MPKPSLYDLLKELSIQVENTTATGAATNDNDKEGLFKNFLKKEITILIA